MTIERAKKSSTASPAAKRRDEPVVALGLTANQWIRNEAQTRGWRLFNLNYCGGSIPDGVELSGALLIRYDGDPWVKAISGWNCPTVFMGDVEATTEMLQPSVTPDMFAEGQLAAEHFAERSFRQLGFFGHDPWSDGKRLWDGFNSHAKELGMNVSLLRTGRISGESNKTRGARRQREFTQWIRETPKPVGILAPGDALAALYCTWASLAGFDIPSEVSILSRGNNPEICESFIPTISHLAFDEQGQIRAACDLLARMMDGEAIPKKPVYIKPIGVVVRESTDMLATPDREVAAVLRYMWDHLEMELTAEDAGREVNISSRQLARKFKQSLNRTFRQELRRKRLEEAKRLLRDTDLTLAAIAPMVGFQSTSYLHRAFQRAFDMTPTAYRRSNTLPP